MQIHELNSFAGTPGASDYLAIDDGSETMKIGASNVGITTNMTQAEAEAGTSTAPRVITPKVLHDYVTGEATDAAETVQVLKISKSSVSSLPTTISNAAITADMEVIHSVLSNPAAQAGDWTVTTSAGSASISGSISDTTNITLYLAVTR